MATQPLRLSVIVACVEAERTLTPCLSALRRSCAHVEAEIVVMYPAGYPPPFSPSGESARSVAGPPGALIPELWAHGLRASQGDVVAFTTAHCIVAQDWADALLAALDAGAVGAGGPLELAESTTPLDWAIYLLRYSAFMPGKPGGPVPEIAGDNAAYRRSALDRHAASLADAFWEVDFHRRVRAEGETLTWVPAAAATVGPSFRFPTILRQRFLHGKHSGRFRTMVQGVPRWRGVLGAPLVPLVLAGRVVRRTLGVKQASARALASLPILMALAGSWSLGEAWGAWRANRTDESLPQMKP